MIVSCTSCQTRFRVDPEKIGPRGARLRCRRCGTTSVVQREAAPIPEPLVEAAPSLESRGASAPPSEAGVSEAPPPAPSPRDPFAEPLSLENDPFAGGPPPAPENPFAARPARPAPVFERDPFAPLEPAEALAQSLSSVDDPFAPSPGPNASAGAGAPLGFADSIDLMPVDARAGESAVAGSGEQRPSADLQRLLAPGPGSPSILPGEASTALALEEKTGPPPGASRSDLANEGASAGGDAGAAEDPAAFLPTRSVYDLTQPMTPAGPAPTAAWVSPAAAAPHAGDAAPRPGGLAPRPASAATVPQPAEKPPRVKVSVVAVNTLSLVFLVAAAAAIFFAWRGNMRTHAWAPVEARSALQAGSLSAGPYDTAAGTVVLVVRGRVTAREPVKGPVRVQVEILDHGSVVASAEGAAGAAGTPEEVYAAGAPGGGEALRRALDARAAGTLAPGESAPFLVLLPPPALDLRGLDLRVLASPAAAGSER